MEVNPCARPEDFYEYLEKIFIEKKRGTTFKVFLENLMKRHEEEFYSMPEKERGRFYIFSYGYAVDENSILEITIETDSLFGTAVIGLKYEQNGCFWEQPFNSKKRF